MDPFTHAALGATVGLVGFRRRLGRRALAVGALIALLPDADVVAGWIRGPVAEWLYHRGLTHAVPFAVVVGPILGWAAWRLLRRGDEGPGPWAGLGVAALLTHPLIDLVTHYGTQLLAPFSPQRFAIPAMPIIDPVFSLMLVVAVVAGLLVRRRVGVAVGIGWAALIACYGYALWGWSINAAAEDEARRQLAAAGRERAEVRAYPTIFQPYFRRIVARLDGEVLVGFHSALNPGPISWTATTPASDAAVVAVAAAPEAGGLSWFADGQVLWRVRRDGTAVVIEARDLRYGFPEPGFEFGIWGLRAPAMADGGAAAHPAVFRERPEITRERLARLWRLVFG